ncbi:MAG: RQC domain-containing protein, partial [Bacteroidota bacterium]
RAKTQEKFIRDDIPIICATIAFGMGIDKSNVRWIIHYNLPKNMESYYQEIGRAGRDGLDSDTLLFYSYADVIQLQSFIEDSGQREILETKLKRIQDYANARICRRKVLLSYFSETLGENCGNCDVCHDPPETIDGTLLTQKALSALVRLREAVGSNMLIDVLRGSARQDLLAKGYQNIKTYGAGSDIPRADWQQFMLQVINMGLAEIAYDEGNALKLTEAGREVLFKGRKVELVKPADRSVVQKKKPQVVKTKAEKWNEALFKRLRALRKTIADKQGVPPYIVFHDATLKGMATSMPTSEPKMRLVSGIGDRKFQLYGAKFISEILDFVQENPDAVPKQQPISSSSSTSSSTKSKKKSAKSPKTKKEATEVTTYNLYRKGKSISDIAQERELTPTTIYKHLQKIYETGEYAFDLFQLITVDELHKILEGIMKTGATDKVKPVYEHFGEAIPYWKIQFAMAYRRRLMQTGK